MFRILFLTLMVLLVGCDDTTGTQTEPNNTTNNVNNVNNDADVGTDACGPGGIPCETDNCQGMCGENEECRSEAGVSACACLPGFHSEAGECVADVRCTDSTCNNHGTCSEGDAGPTCACEAGFAGANCNACADGFVPDGNGGCTDDLCSLIDCVDRECRVDGGVASCVCEAGTHDENGTCVPDQTCMPGTCNARGTCTESVDGISCACDEGWAEPFCGQCDTAAGYHDDGAGGCTMDPCAPNPCDQPNQSQCSVDNDMPVCACDAGYHEDAQGVCVIDEVCGANSCSGNGTCDDSSGTIVCQCDTGYDGTTCDACDALAGYHPDGAGGCTMDVCLPNPCTTTPNKSVCSDNGAGGFACGCAAGYHDDGLGGCTDDPCTPNICAASNQACRVTNNQPECYVPDCNDNNPCTDDTRVNGVCQNTNVANGTACTTDACTVGTTCQAGTCGGGSARVCNDNNPCTDDACNPTNGCVFTNDDTNVPSDGLACTTDACAAGFESHTPTNALCDNGLYCDGVEICAPTAAGANAHGCLTTNVPVAPPNPSPCQTYGACNEATDSFPLSNLAAGAACNDGIYCTTGDVCDAAGQCQGTLQANCGVSASCTTTHPFSGVANIPDAPLNLTITLAGAALPATGTDSTTHFLYAVAKDTGVRHLISAFYWYNNALVRDDSTRLMPGVYDILYRKGETSTDSGYVYRTDAFDVGPNGYRLVKKDVVFTGSPLAVDIPNAALNLTISLDGSPLPATGTDSTTHFIYAVAKDTGVRHLISAFYWYNNALVRDDSTHLMPGTYDILYRKGETSTDSGYVYRTDAFDIGPNGYRLIATDVNFTGAPLSVNIADSPLNLGLTLAGGALPATGTDSTTHFIYAVSKDTGVRHLISAFYWYNNALVRDDATRLMSGTYDILYRKGETSTDSGYVYRTDAFDIGPNAYRLIDACVAFP
ncbi:MAG: hypothetical protein R3E66_19020 [bacterium]